MFTPEDERQFIQMLGKDGFEMLKEALPKELLDRVKDEPDPFRKECILYNHMAYMNSMNIAELQKAQMRTLGVIESLVEKVSNITKVFR